MQQGKIHTHTRSRGRCAGCKYQTPSRVLVGLPQFTFCNCKTESWAELIRARRSKESQRGGGVPSKIFSTGIGWTNDDQEERGEGEEKEKMMNKECARSSSFAKIVFLFFTRPYFIFIFLATVLSRCCLQDLLNFLRKHGDVGDSRCAGTGDFHCGAARESLGADKETIVLSWLWHCPGKSALGPCLRCRWRRVQPRFGQNR